MEMPLTPAEVIKLLRIPKATFFRYQQRGFFRFAEAAKPMGTRRYIKAKIETLAAGESTVQFGRKRSAR
jgi:ABC-type Mn2+/Zn2+ transport system ATPase subunit